MTGQQRRNLQQALLDAFPTKSSLQQMLSFKLERNLDVVSGGSNLGDVVFNLITTAESQGWIQDLVRAAKDSNPGNSNLQNITLKSLPNTSTETINIDELVQTARDKIGAYINKRCGTMRVLGMTQPTELNDIYTSVNILEKITKLKWSSIDELLQNANNENFYRISLGGVREERVPGLEAVNQHSKLMILGKPGAGKTTFLKHIALQCINDNFEPSRIPLFITLKDFAEADNQPNLLEYLTQLFDSELINSQGVKQLIEQGRLLILLDGLDEVKEVDNKRIVKDIKNITIKYNKNKFIITCRIAACEYIFENFTDVEIADFDDKQIETFVNKWFTTKNDTSKAEEFIQELAKNKPIKELAITPILLTLLCLVFEQKGTFPQSRAKLYEEGLDILLEKWDTTRGIERDQLPYKNLSLKQRKDLLIKIAYPTFESSKYFFEPEDIEEYITQYYNSLNIKDDIDTKKVLQSIEAQHGLLIERARGIYSFSHLTFHEYFTARNIATSTTNNELLLQLFTHITERRWREVFLLTAGLMRGGTDQLLLLMEKQSLSYINTPGLQALLRWAHEETAGSAGDIKPVGKRALAIVYAYANANVEAYANAGAYVEAFAITFAYAEAYAIAEAYAEAYAINRFIKSTDFLKDFQIFNNVNYIALIAQMEALKTQIPSDEQPQSVHQSFTKQLMETWLRGFNLTPEMINLSKKEIEALGNYLYVNRLIIECKDAAVRVSPSTWEGIEERMLKLD